MPERTVVSLMGRAKNRIARIGVELEGGWRKLPPGTEIIRDGSVIFEGGTPNPPRSITRLLRSTVESEALEGRRLYETWQAIQATQEAALPKYIGELPSAPMAPGDLKAWLDVCYPHAVNATCGMHVHMSFTKGLHYQRLMVPEYQVQVIRALTAWAMTQGFPADHHIWARLQGQNRYCLHEFFPDDQVAIKSKSYDHHSRGHRYTAINYSGAHSTIECRLLPMMTTKEQALEAIQVLLGVTNAMILSQIYRERAVVEVYEDDCLDIREESRVCV